MLVLTRRPGESVQIADAFEFRILDVDAQSLVVTCAIAASDGRDEKLRCIARPDGTAMLSTADEED
jgi:hypothetical protein